MVSSFQHSLTHLTQRWTRPMQINTLLKAMVSGSINIYLYSIYPNKITRYLSWVFATQLDPAIGSWVSWRFIKTADLRLPRLTREAKTRCGTSGRREKKHGIFTGCTYGPTMNGILKNSWHQKTIWKAQWITAGKWPMLPWLIVGLKKNVFAPLKWTNVVSDASHLWMKLLLHLDLPKEPPYKINIFLIDSHSEGDVPKGTMTKIELTQIQENHQITSHGYPINILLIIYKITIIIDINWIYW